MRLKRLRRSGWAAGLGIVALGLNLLVPVHLAFDLAEARTHKHHAAHHHHNHSFEWRLLALASGHFESGGPGHHGQSGHHHGADQHHACQVCSATGTLAAFAPAAATSFPVPATDTVLRVLGGATEAHEPASTAAYRSRAPPLS